MATYTDLRGIEVEVEYLDWLEEGRDEDGEPCARFAIGGEESVWLNEDNEEVTT
jgi:hypothetical protein